MSDKAVRIEEFGGSDKMQLVDVEVGDPGPGQVRIRHKAVGLNFIDIYQRSGVYPLPLPVTLGMEGAGVIEAVGEGVTHLAEGDRAAYASAPPGSPDERATRATPPPDEAARTSPRVRAHRARASARSTPCPARRR